MCRAVKSRRKSSVVGPIITVGSKEGSRKVCRGRVQAEHSGDTVERGRWGAYLRDNFVDYGRARRRGKRANAEQRKRGARVRFVKVRWCGRRCQTEDKDERDARHMQTEYVSTSVTSVEHQSCKLPAYVERVLDHCYIELLEVVEEDSQIGSLVQCTVPGFQPCNIIVRQRSGGSALIWVSKLSRAGCSRTGTWRTYIR